MLVLFVGFGAHTTSVSSSPDDLDHALPSLASVTILARSNFNLAEAQGMLVRFHYIPGHVVQVNYNDAAKTFVERELSKPLQYQALHRKSPSVVTHYLLSPDHHEQYSIGGGANQLEVWDSRVYGHYKYLEHMGFNVIDAVSERWPKDRYQVSVDDLSAESNDRRVIYSVQRLADRADIVEQIIVHLTVGSEGEVGARRLEYLRDGIVTKTVENEDFTSANGIYYPRRIRVRHMGAASWNEEHEILFLQPNLVLDPDVFSSPAVRSDARVRIHHLKNGRDVVTDNEMISFFDDSVARLGSPSSAELASLKSQNVSALPASRNNDRVLPTNRSEATRLPVASAQEERSNTRMLVLFGGIFLIAGIVLMAWSIRRKRALHQSG